MQEQALARGRLLELLSRHDGDAAPEALFSVGLFSMLDVLLQLPLAAALAPLRLGDPASQALLRQAGAVGRPPGTGGGVVVGRR